MRGRKDKLILPEAVAESIRKLTKKSDTAKLRINAFV